MIHKKQPIYRELCKSVICACKIRRTLLISGQLGVCGQYWDGWTFTGVPSWYLPEPPRPTQPGHPSVGSRSEYWRWSRPSLGKNGEFCVTVGPVTRTAENRLLLLLFFSSSSPPLPPSWCYRDSPFTFCACACQPTLVLISSHSWHRCCPH